MSMFYLLLVALVQGITEFLPISSSGHLILLPSFTGQEDQGLVIDVAVHVGTLGAVVLYFWRDVSLGLSGIPRMLTGRIDTPGSKLAFLLAVATVPVILGGFLLVMLDLTEALRSVTLIGWTMLLFGIVLYWADQKGAQDKKAEDWTLRDSIVFGLMQALALIPGTSRSGITITAGRMLGYDRESSARIAMLMSIPTIVASGVILGAEVIGTADVEAARNGAIAATMAFVAAFAALAFMMRLLRSVSFTPYVIYRVVFGAVLIWLGYSGALTTA
jgi:undecaprenyl-diphosphatase